MLDPRALASDVDVDGRGSRVVQVAAGSHHTCAILEGGRLRCWGYGWHGQLGTGNISLALSVSSLIADVDVDGKGSRVVQVAAGEEHTCAVLEGGRLRCWGSARFGQLGTTSRDTVVAPSSLTGDVDVDSRGSWVLQVSAGSHHTCALLEGGRLRCWGSSSFG